MSNEQDQRWRVSEEPYFEDHVSKGAQSTWLVENDRPYRLPLGSCIAYEIVDLPDAEELADYLNALEVEVAQLRVERDRLLYANTKLEAHLHIIDHMNSQLEAEVAELRAERDQWSGEVMPNG